MKVRVPVFKTLDTVLIEAGLMTYLKTCPAGDGVVKIRVHIRPDHDGDLAIFCNITVTDDLQIRDTERGVKTIADAITKGLESYDCPELFVYRNYRRVSEQAAMHKPDVDSSNVTDWE